MEGGVIAVLALHNKKVLDLNLNLPKTLIPNFGPERAPSMGPFRALALKVYLEGIRPKHIV